MYGYVLRNPSYWLDPSGREAALAAGGFWAWVWGTGGTTAAGSAAVAAAPVVIAAGAAVAAPIAGYHVGDRWEQTYGWGEAVGNWWSPAPLAPSPSPTPPTIPNTFPRTRPQSIPNPQPEPDPETEPNRPYVPELGEEIAIACATCLTAQMPNRLAECLEKVVKTCRIVMGSTNSAIAKAILECR
ncbi:hypothetical protein HG15A2_39550 [Adhaeretor mobilis]|uniref:Uncharacterized protein n=2 Tax=Adhaeretor mobilis TaxID=1930276 RepID=A0A517N0E7_9BACT|nr:hypothetical protein HG15A2_39550 [Adhaeretor mobilis]